MDRVQNVSLNAEIRQVLAAMNMPAELAAIIGQGIEKLRADSVGQGLAIGTEAPDFQLRNQKNRQIKLSEVLANGPAVLKFIRGEWCPICNTEMAALKRIQPELKALGAKLLVINPQKPDKGLALQGKHALGFDILSDEQQAVIRKFNLQFIVPLPVEEVYKMIGLNLPEHTADGTWNLPVPATFILDKQGVIRARHVDVNYMQRMEPVDILNALRSIR
jgi:peroxiredoxin